MIDNTFWLLLMVNVLSKHTQGLTTDPVVKDSCIRVCDGVPKTCKYKFQVEKFYTMSKACYDCPQKLTHCYREDCIAVDGISRPVTTVNRQIPGPAIEVCLGDTIEVEVENLMGDASTSIHWHGHHQVKTPYMDGVPFITQCPIHPGTTFRYKMKADNKGTLFWHAHTGVQRADGVFGALIVRTPDSMNVHRGLYNEDLSEHIIIVNDWTHMSSMDKYLAHVLGLGNNKADLFLVNGRGRYYENTEQKANTPLAVFNVQKDVRYRFRLINSGVNDCPVEMYIDNHRVTYIASDGYDFDPVEADSLVSYAGERWDFVLNADQERGNYWIRFTGLEDCVASKAHQVAILHYEGAPDGEPDASVGYNLHPKPIKQLNPVNVPITEPHTISVPNLHASDKNPDPLLTEEPDLQIVLEFDFQPVDHPLYHKQGFYGFKQVKSQYQRYTPQFKHVTFKWPHSPLLSQYKDIPENAYCSSSSFDVTKCKDKYCECTHVIEIEWNDKVELILIDKGEVFNANHPFHLHGYAFRVVGMDRLGDETKGRTVENLDEEGKLVRNLKDAPLKDTVTVPDGGYTILRFHANNPGYWIFHCHIEYHLEEGMAVVFKIGDHGDFPKAPKNFPTCGDFLHEDEEKNYE